MTIGKKLPRYKLLNKTKRSYTQLDSRKQVMAFQNSVTTIHKEAEHLLR